MIFLSVALAAEPVEPPPATREIAATIAATRGHPFELVPFLSLSQEESVAYYRRLLSQALPPSEIRRLGLGMEVLDLLPEEEGYVDATLALVEGGLFGFYDTIDRVFVIVQRPDGVEIEDLVLGHELVHVMQDQAFDLSLIRASGLDNGDVVAAMQCLVEGDATYTELLASRGEGAQSADLRELVPGIWPDSPSPSDTGGIPLALIEQTLFNYTVGARFVQAVRGRGWDNIDRLYASPPLSTEQILHPEKLAGSTEDRPVAVSLSGEALAAIASGYTPVVSDSIGEIGLLTMFRAWGLTERAAALADGWDGDRMVILENKEGEWLLVWRTVWDTDADAIVFEEALKERWGRESGCRTERRDRSVVVLRQANEPQGALVEAAFQAKVKEARRVQDLVARGSLKRAREESD